MNLVNNNNNNNEYLERLTRTGPQLLHILHKYILSKFNAYNMNAHAHTHTCRHTHRLTHALTDSHTCTHIHTYIHTHTHTRAHTHHSLDGKKKNPKQHNYIDLLNIYTYNYTIHTFQTLYNTYIIQA